MQNTIWGSQNNISRNPCLAWLLKVRCNCKNTCPLFSTSELRLLSFLDQFLGVPLENASPFQIGSERCIGGYRGSNPRRAHEVGCVIWMNLIHGRHYSSLSIRVKIKQTQLWTLSWSDREVGNEVHPVKKVRRSHSFVGLEGSRVLDYGSGLWFWTCSQGILLKPSSGTINWTFTHLSTPFLDLLNISL